MFNQMVEAAKDFWGHVQTQTPVSLSADDDTLKDLYAGSNKNFIELYPADAQTQEAANALEEKIAYIQELKGQKSSIEKEIKELETGVKDIIKDNAGIKTPKYVISRK